MCIHQWLDSRGRSGKSTEKNFQSCNTILLRGIDTELMILICYATNLIYNHHAPFHIAYLDSAMSSILLAC
jgi:hypothetical protein